MPRSLARFVVVCSLVAAGCGGGAGSVPQDAASEAALVTPTAPPPTAVAAPTPVAAPSPTQVPSPTSTAVPTSTPLPVATATPVGPPIAAPAPRDLGALQLRISGWATDQIDVDGIHCGTQESAWWATTITAGPWYFSWHHGNWPGGTGVILQTTEGHWSTSDVPAAPETTTAFEDLVLNPDARNDEPIILSAELRCPILIAPEFSDEAARFLSATAGSPVHPFINSGSSTTDPRGFTAFVPSAEAQQVVNTLRTRFDRGWQVWASDDTWSYSELADEDDVAVSIAPLGEARDVIMLVDVAPVNQGSSAHEVALWFDDYVDAFNLTIEEAALDRLRLTAGAEVDIEQITNSMRWPMFPEVAQADDGTFTLDFYFS